MTGERRAQVHLTTNDPAALRAEIVAGVAPDTVRILGRASGCFHGDASPHQATLETRADDADAVIDAVAALANVDRAASMAVVADEIVFIEPPEPTPVRYQYLMHRRHDFDHDGYLHRYREIHSQFGIDTPHIEGYIQLHVDLAASAELAEATGLGAAACDSVSELHLRSIEHFIAGIVAEPEVGRLAQEDEERFVDRAASFGFCHDVLQG